MSNLRKKLYTKLNQSINPEVIQKVEYIFEQNGWKIESEKGEVLSWRTRFNKFCDTIKSLNPKEQNLIFELTSKYTYISSSEYLGMIAKLLSKMYDCNFNNIKKYNTYYVMPLISPQDRLEHKDKSSVFMQYLFGATELSYVKELEGIKINKVSSIEGLPKNINNKPTSIIIIVDDFIGTGETALECLKEYEDTQISKEKILVISLVTMKEGKDKIEEKGYTIFTLEEREKGISDNYYGKELEERISIMREIEKILGVKEEEQFGYGSSEALVTMIRTPNNTFPIFWYDKNNSPFPRR